MYTGFAESQRGWLLASFTLFGKDLYQKGLEIGLTQKGSAELGEREWDECVQLGECQTCAFDSLSER